MSITQTVATFAGVLAVSFLLSSNARAQAPEDLARQDIQNRINRVIDSTMKIVGDQASDFNARIAAINEARPLELQNFDSVQIATNISRVLQFVDYLTQFRTADDSLSRMLEDSLFVLHEGIPESRDRKTLEAFQESYAADRKAFNKYVATLRKLYSEVLDALLFMQHANYEVQNNQLQFKSSKDIAEYRKLMKPIDATSKELKKASEESRKATQWANKKIAEINGQQTSVPKPVKQ